MTTTYNTINEMIDALCWDKAMKSGGMDGYSNYSGPDYSKYIVLLGRSRDSDTLSDSNFESAKSQFKGNRGVIAARFGHWGCGWFELLLVSKTAKKALSIALEINNALADYPVLDDCDFNDRERQHQDGIWDGNKGSMMDSTWRELFGDKEVPEEFDVDFECLVYALYESDCGYRGVEDGWACLDCGWDDYKVKEFNLESNKYLDALNAALNSKKRA